LRDRNASHFRDRYQPDATPVLVERVHELYEELGREDVRAVQDWDKKHQAEIEARKDRSTK